MGIRKVVYALGFLAAVSLRETGSLRKSEDEITEDYDVIDRLSPPLFVNNTKTDFLVASGKEVQLECRVRNLGDRAVSWIRKKDFHVLTTEDIVFTSDPRYSIQKGNLNWILNIKNAQVNDSGTFECQINTSPKKSKSYKLKVVVSSAKILGDRDVFVHLDSDINLTCKVQETPDPPSAITWLKDGRAIDSLLSRGGISVVTDSRRRSSRLLVSKVTSKDAGNYSCQPINAKIDSVMVHVIEGADPRANVMASRATSIGLYGLFSLIVVPSPFSLLFLQARNSKFHSSIV